MATYTRQYFGQYFAPEFVSPNQKWAQNTEEVQMFLLHFFLCLSLPSLSKKVTNTDAKYWPKYCCVKVADVWILQAEFLCPVYS